MFEKKLFASEERSTRTFLLQSSQLLRSTCVKNVEKAIAWCQRKTSKELAATQHEALQKALESRVLVITGGPGVGKTTLVDSILLILRAK